MKLKSCQTPLEIGKNAADASLTQITALKEPPVPVIIFSKNNNNIVVEEAFEASMSETAKKAANQAQAGQTLLRNAIQRLGGESPVTLAAQLGIRVECLQKNWDMWGSATQRINGVFVSESFRIARVAPADLKQVLLRRIYTVDQLHLFLDQALEMAAGNVYKIDVYKAQNALGHHVTTDVYGLAMDFNPGTKMLEQAAYRELRETLTDNEITKDLLEETMDRVLRNMHGHLYGESPETAVAMITMAGARTKDEIAAVKIMAQNADMASLPNWAGITRSSTDREISALIKKLKDSGFVFHHSGKVSLDAQGYPMVEMQLIKTEAHRKILTTYDGITMSDVDLWQQALGGETRINTTVEKLLQHVGGCKVFTSFYGIKGYK